MEDVVKSAIRYGGPAVQDADPVLEIGADSASTLNRIGELANRCRQVLLEMIYLADSGHVGSSLSCVDILSVLKFDQMDWEAMRSRVDSDVFVLSKGHAVPAWYAALIVSGELDRACVSTLRTLDSELQGHPDRNRCDLVDVSTGALGQGLSIGVGRAEAKRLKGQNSYVYCVVGDGEIQEGQVWEALMYAGVRHVSNLVLFVDYNRSQNDGALDEIMSLHPLSEKIESFRWHVQEVDGHSHAALRDAVIAAKNNGTQPSAIIAYTRKGYLGRDRVLLNGAHGGSLTLEEFEQAIEFLRESA
jgi:transketolase